MNRPLVWVAGAFAAGMIAAAMGLCPGIALPLFLCGISMALAWVSSAPRVSRPASVILAGFALGALLWNAHHAGLPGDPLGRFAAEHPEIKEWIVEGRVRLADLEETNPDNYQFLLDADSVTVANRTQTLTDGVSVRWARPGRRVIADERVRVCGKLTPAISHLNPGINSYEEYLRWQGIHSALKTSGPDAVEVVAPGRQWSFRHWAARMRLAQTDALAQAVPASALPFVYAVWLGYRTTVSQDEYQDYIQSGTAHILSVSGIHMAMVFVSAAFVFRLFVRSKRLRAINTMSVILMFTLMSGLRASALRSAIMVWMYLLADLFDREPDAPTALSLSALLLLGWNPDSLFDGGFQLSFLSIASILLFSDKIESDILTIPGFLRDRFAVSRFTEWSSRLKTLPMLSWSTPRLDTVRGVVATSLAVQVLPTPLALRCFHVFPLLAVAANLIVIPLATAALWLCFLTGVSGAFSSHIGLLFGHALACVVWLIRAVSQFIATPSSMHPILVSPTLAAMVCYYAAAACGLAALKAPRRIPWVAAMAVLALLTVGLWRTPFPSPTVAFLDVGHGDSTFVRSRDGTTLLVDGGDRSAMADAGQRIVAPFLWSNQVRRLDYVALSHPDRDHIGGLFYVLDHFPVGAMLLSAVATDRPLERQLLDLCARRGIPVRRLQKGETITANDLTIEALHPPADWPPGEAVNDQSLVLRVQWEGVSILLPGDVEFDAEGALIAADCRADVLKAPHHGSQTSSSARFITAVDPSDCVVSTGGTSGHEPADQAVLARYRARGVRLWRTDQLGGITLLSDNGDVTIQGERPLRGYPCATDPGTALRN